MGYYGECLTFRILSKIKKGKVLTNLVIPNGDKCTEIDLLLLHPTGIFVVESKNYSGNIYGDEDSRNWVKSYDDGKSYKFYNPIWQNNMHIRCLNALLKDKYYGNFYNIIAFSKRCEIKEVNHSKEVFVVNRYKLKKTIKKLIRKNKNVLNQKEIEELFHFLIKYRELNYENNSLHYEFKYQGILKK
jgi:hypothetical protein